MVCSNPGKRDSHSLQMWELGSLDHFRTYNEADLWIENDQRSVLRGETTGIYGTAE